MSTDVFRFEFEYESPLSVYSTIINQPPLSPFPQPLSFCLKEIGWALAASKPVIVVTELEGRFFPFDMQRWKENRCTRGANDTWTDGWLSCEYEKCPAEIKALIEEHEGKMIPYRRRWV